MKTKFGLVVAVGLLMIAGQSVHAQEMPHEGKGLDCQACHVTESFGIIQFDHDSTAFSLDGHHQNVDCKSCHTLKDFTRVENTCRSCHTDVHEVKLGLDCARCHSPNGWSKFDLSRIHIETDFPFMGRHALADCQSCHKGLARGDFTFNSTRCVECHQSNYLEASSPNHVSNGFSTDCESCHQMAAWRPAMLRDHDIFFPIYSGEHNGQWDLCSTCHTTQDSYRDFSCLTCHSHRQGEMDSEHQGIPGYAYNSQDCYLCHPTGKAGSFTDHDGQFFPIFSGSHQGAWDECATCHTVPIDRTVYDCLSCHEHRQEEMDGKHGGMSGYTYASTNCYDCHPTGQPGQFTDHDGQFFPIFSGSHQGAWDECATCHTVPIDRTVYDCLSCHEHRQEEMDGKHGGMSGYTYASTNCYDCHPSGQPGQFTDHDGQFFPIFSGEHRGKWDNDCSTCHTVANDRSVFTCLDCHEHSQSRMDDKHLGKVSGYDYESGACYSCHPDGRE